ncbi:MAG: thiamine-phosphate kinase [Pelistega sp.]|nr:thiamine-phosphate kinase [Pelistega sp.]
MSGEFGLIQRYFSQTKGQINHNPNIILGVNDDCAIFQPVTSLSAIATSKDLLIEGRHFFSDVDPYALGHKALAVNLSDLAAMGAKPIACLLGLALPHVDEAWLAKFSAGFYALADRYHCPLIGGDTTRSESGITLSVTVFGEVKPPYLMRNQGQVGDTIWVSGALGAAHTALELLFIEKRGQSLTVEQNSLLAQTRQSLEYPEPRVALGQALVGIAHACLDISDGLLQDLGHILKQSQVGAIIEERQLPVHEALMALPVEQRRQAVLAGGDVYELCFTAPAARNDEILAIAQQLNIPLTAIGRLVEDTQSQCIVMDEQGNPVSMDKMGFDHFSV